MVKGELENATRDDAVGRSWARVESDGTIHRIAAWFAAHLCPRVSLSDRAPSQTPSWVHGFFPFEQPFPGGAWEAVKTGL